MSAKEILDKISITGLTADSRKVKPGYLFAAIPGTKVDGAAFIPDAIKAGATVILANADVSADDLPGGIHLITDSNPRRRLAKLAAQFYTPQPGTVVAVTGTNGKTSVADFTRQLWTTLKKPAASIGTLGLVTNQDDAITMSGLTTPDPVELHATLGELKAHGIDNIAMEASSHGLDMYRLDGTAFTAAAFTNLSRDHLDYHGGMEAYRAAKLRLFEELLSTGGTAVVNSAAPEFDAIANIATERKQRVIAYGLTNGQIRCIKADTRPSGFGLELDVMGESFDVDFPLPGRFQIENALCALGLVLACGAEATQVVPHLADLRGVRGRMERVAVLANGATVYVDYAHTPDALETVLKSVRPHARDRLHVIFGCGGDRDPGKRPLMGKTCHDFADVQIVTDDNPRTEDPAPIRAQAMTGCPEGIEVGDRREAIRTGLKNLNPGDILVVAGKGHEQGQTVGDKVLPFDDAGVVREEVKNLGLDNSQ